MGPPHQHEVRQVARPFCSNGQKACTKKNTLPNLQSRSLLQPDARLLLRGAVLSAWELTRLLTLDKDGFGWMMEERYPAGTPAEHLLIWHIDTQSLARRGISCSDELYRLLSSHGRVASLEVYLHLSAAAVSFTRTQDAQKVGHLLKGVPSPR